jgi:hypothetical protein
MKFIKYHIFYKKRLCLFGLLVLSNGACWAQTEPITGTVVDDRSDSLPFVTVAVPGSTTDVAIDISSKFS